MDPIDLLHLAAQAAHAIRCSSDEETGLAEGYKFLRKRRPKDEADPLPVRIARLMCAAGEQRAALLEFLWSRPKRVALLNRPDSEPVEEMVKPDPEAERLREVVELERARQRDMMEEGFSGFNIIRRAAGGTFGGRFVTRGKKGVMYFKPDGLPKTVRGLIDYPLEVPVLFTIEAGEEPWSLWDICCAYADQYVKIYEHPDRYGIWGHDLADLVIEGLIYYPQHQLVYAEIGS
jgi:hypothetical protein